MSHSVQSGKVSALESTHGGPTASPPVTSSSSVLSTCISIRSSDVLSEVLVLPQPEPKTAKRKPGLNSKVACISDDDGLLELETKADENIAMSKRRSKEAGERTEKKDKERRKN